MTVALIVVAAVGWLLAIFLARLAYLLFDKYGKAVLELDDLRAEESSGLPAGLSVLSPAPDFRAKDLGGKERTLQDFLGDAPLVVAFFDPQCGFCNRMAPELGALPDGGRRVLLVSRGDPDEHKRLAEEHSWNCEIVIEGDDRSVMTAYEATGTPMGYLLTEDGLIGSELAIGGDAVLELVTATPAGAHGNGGGGNGAASVRDVSHSRIKRDGLEAGTPAPVFTLPDLEGNERSLGEFHGKRVLLVFSDTNCVPCQALVPKLVELHERRRGENLEIVMVSRGGADANSAKATEYNVDFPVLLQSGWEVSKLYAMFATPVGYLIDEQGIVSKDVAVGGDAIVALV